MKDSNTALNNASGSHDATDQPKTMEVECEETSSAAAPHNKSVVCYASASELRIYLEGSKKNTCKDAFKGVSLLLKVERGDSVIATRY